MTVHGQHYWAKRFATDAAQLEQRRQAAGLKQTQAAADALRQAWSGVRAIHLFGSTLGERFCEHSDLDLLVDGLPASDLLDAIALAEAAGPLPVDLKRSEDFSADLGDRLGSGGETVEAAALRLHSFYTGVERMLLLVSRVVNGGTPSRGEGWHRRLLERMAMPTDTRPAVLQEGTQRDLQEYLRFRQLVSNLYADELRAEPIHRLIQQLQHTWRQLSADIAAFQSWLTTIAMNEE